MGIMTGQIDKRIPFIYFPNHRASKDFPRAQCPLPTASRFSGFTLIELVVVLALLSIVVALVVPRLPSTGNMALKSSARSTASLLRYLGDRSIGSKNIYRLRINISENIMKVTRKMPGGDEISTGDPLLSRNVLENGVVITDLQTPRLGKVTEGEVLIDFGAAGLAEFLTLHLTSPQGENFTIAGYPGGGKVKLLAGYQELSL